MIPSRPGAPGPLIEIPVQSLGDPSGGRGAFKKLNGPGRGLYTGLLLRTVGFSYHRTGTSLGIHGAGGPESAGDPFNKEPVGLGLGPGAFSAGPKIRVPL